MYTYKLNKLPKNTIEIVVKTPSSDIKSEYDIAFENLRTTLAVEGFRKGKVPASVAVKNLSKDKVYQQLIQNYIPVVYSEIVKKEDIKPIIQPKVDLVKAKEGEDWEFSMKTAETPDVKLGKYKEKVKDARAKISAGDIWVPGKGEEPTPEEKEKSKQAQFQAGLDALLTEAVVDVSDILIEEELEKRLARVVDDVQKVGLTIDSYLKSKQITIDDLKNQLKKEIENTYKIEFILQSIADAEGIQVTDADIEKVFSSIKDEKEKNIARQNAYYYAAFLRKQKTLDFISSL